MRRSVHPPRARLLAFGFVLLLCASPRASADAGAGDVSLANPPKSVVPIIPIIPVREHEIWFRDTWSARINAGYETDKDLGQITTGDVEVDSDNSSLIGIDFGRPLVDNFRDLPIDFAWRIGVQRFLDHSAGASGFAQTVYLKMYLRPFPWERWVGTRIGFGEGVSYAWRVPDAERAYAANHDESTHRLLNYLDVSLDVNVGDVIRNESAHACWLGLVISHRSGVFGLVDLFGNVHNGSNYNTAALECDF